MTDNLFNAALKGVEKTDRNINKILKILGSRIDAEALKIAVDATIAAHIKKTAPIRSGQYRSHTRVFAGQQGGQSMAILSNDKIYAPVLEFGDKAKIIRPVSRKALAWRNVAGVTDKGNHKIFLKNGKYTIDKEEGTIFAKSVRMPERKGRHIMENATRDKKDDTLREYGKGLNKVIIAAVEK